MTRIGATDGSNPTTANVWDGDAWVKARVYMPNLRTGGTIAFVWDNTGSGICQECGGAIRGGGLRLSRSSEAVAKQERSPRSRSLLGLTSSRTYRRITSPHPPPCGVRSMSPASGHLQTHFSLLTWCSRSGGVGGELSGRNRGVAGRRIGLDARQRGKL